MTSTRSPGWFTGRTRLITIASIVAVGLAGATAVSANIGILDTASDTDVGNLSASGDLVTPPTQVIDVYLPGDTSPTSTTAVTTLPPATASPVLDTGVQEFTVDAAGVIAVASTDTGLRLDRVMPNAGWSWTLTQSGPTELMVTMTDGIRILEFTASVGADGNIVASVDEPIVTAAPPASTTAGGYDDHDDDHDDDGGYDDDDGYDDDEYEGGEDDD